MPSIVYDDFGGGLDLRRSAALAAANILRACTNAYITTGRAIRKRPCLRRVATLESGTVGLKAGNGVLNTFYGPGAITITHANPLFVARRAQNPLNPSEVLTKIHALEVFNNLPYVAVEYANASVYHHYLDDSTLTAWAAATAYSVGNVRRPTTANGYRYRVFAIAGTGTSGAVEPAWPISANLTVIDNPGPNQVTWVCDTNAVTDVNCPHGKSVLKLLQKIYSNSGGNVRFCKTSNPRDWTAAGDAGFIPSQINSSGSTTVTALGDYSGDLAVFFSDAMQLWDVASDPNANALKGSSPFGTRHRRTPRGFANDLMFLSAQGFRTVSLAVLTESLTENDIGAPIDALRSEIADADDPIAVYYPTLGQLVVFNRTRAYALSYSKSSKISAWGVYDFPVAADDVTVLDGTLYLRSGNAVYALDSTIFADDGVVPQVSIDMYFQDGRQPGILKQFMGFDVSGTGTFTVAFKYNSRDSTDQTDPYSVSLDTRPEAMNPMELAAVSVAPVVRHQANEEFQLDLMQLYFEALGPV